MFAMDDFLARCCEAVAAPQPTLAVREVMERALRDRREQCDLDVRVASLPSSIGERGHASPIGAWTSPLPLPP